MKTPTWCNSLKYFISLNSFLYMFRVLHAPIIRSFKCTFRYGITWSRYKPVDAESSDNRVLCVCSPGASVYRACCSRIKRWSEVRLLIQLQHARYSDAPGLQTHNTLLADDSASTGLYRDQIIPYPIVHVWSSWWWVGVTPETCREKN
jgi:hypothetical protein